MSSNKVHKKTKRKVVIQLLREFWFAATLSIIWTIISYYQAKDSFSLANAITAITTSFFLVSWFTGQITRVKRQQGVQSGLEKIVDRFDEVIDRLEKSSETVIDRLTGRDSFVYATLGFNNPLCQMSFIQQGNSAVHNVHVRIVDINDTGIFRPKKELGITIGTLAQRVAKTGPMFNLNNMNSLSLSIFFTTDAGIISQGLKLKKINNEWISATHVSSPSGTVHVYIHKNFPIENDPQLIQWESWGKELNKS